jgi:phosphonate transport system substrate-binding protein
MGQKRSVMGVIKGDYAAAAVSDDKVQSLIDEETIQKSAIKIIYQSEVIPRTTIGWFYNLNPHLAAKIQKAILSFRPTIGANTNSDEAVDTSLHFIPIDYKKDFALVRLIDASFDPRLDAKTRIREAATTQPSTAG